MRHEREQWWRLIATALNFTHKVLCAAVFGSYGHHARSWEQLALLVLLQVRYKRDYRACVS